MYQFKLNFNLKWFKLMKFNLKWFKLLKLLFQMSQRKRRKKQ